MGSMDPFTAGDRMFSFMSIVFPLMFLLVFGLIIYGIIASIRQSQRNNKQPILTVQANIVNKRTNVRSTTHHHHDNDGIHNHSSGTSTDYYITFQVESGDRMEFEVSGQESGLLAEGDYGKLTFQGTRYLGFQR
ncbi:DUF2500 domain-containing protein [Paenibacillus lignilyticus]|uniref:DUF2500 domain-containing protein n=1 Tax=Paenibacillus lignilyticus TaxID=1172615 RepID=A0ABS5C5M6_9BACL|nr:DUF2500 domain-containing protein [Paenibacillus lignilyticus]MBP3961304.1 DUF2500 domain-containing protein [Paenibacillus lignilyticus]